MRKILTLVCVLVLLAIIAVPAVAVAATTGTTEIDGTMAAATVSVAAPGVFNFGTFHQGWNPSATTPAYGTTQGNVSFTTGSDYTSWQLKVYSKNDGTYDFSQGKMYANPPARYLDNALLISLDNSSGSYTSAATGITVNSNAASYPYWLYAYQNITNADALAGAGSYFIIIYSEVTLTP